MTKMLGGISLVFLVGFLAIIIFSRKLKKTLLGMEPEEIALQNTISSTVLKSVREGVLVIDAAGRLQVVNDQARKILAKAHLPSDVLGQWTGPSRTRASWRWCVPDARKTMPNRISAAS